MSYPPIDLKKKKADALIIHCADPRFQRAYRQVIDGLGQYYDLLVAPGASKPVADDPKMIESIKLLESFHHFETIHILDHIECGAFGEVNDELKDHTSSLKTAAEAITKALPNVKVVPHLLGEKDELTLENQG